MNYKNLGLEFENECARGLRTRYGYVSKVPDTRSLSSLVNKVLTWVNANHAMALAFRRQFNFLPTPSNFVAMKSPYDFCVCDKGKFIAIECKQTKNTALAFNNIKPHQLVELEAVRAAGGDAYLVVNFNNRERTKAKKVNSTYAIDIKTFLSIKSVLDEENRKSMNRKFFDLHAKSCRRIKNNGKFEIDFSSL